MVIKEKEKYMEKIEVVVEYIEPKQTLASMLLGFF